MQQLRLIGSRFFPFLLLILFGMPSLSAQQRLVRGRVVENGNGEAMPGVQVVVGSTFGCVTDEGGYFSLWLPTDADGRLADSLRLMEFSMVGYEPCTQRIGRNEAYRIKLRPSTHNLRTVTISTRRNRKHYSRKDNPALELVREVMAHRQQNHLASLDFYSCRRYSKTNLAIDEFHPDFRRNWLWKHFPFAEDYIDRTLFDNTEILNFAIQESFRDEYHRVPGILSRTLLTATRSDGVIGQMSDEGMGEGPEGLFQPVDIYLDEILFLDNQFISPLSSKLGNLTYHYSITDTVVVDGVQCVEIAFQPASKGGFTFTGRMLVAVGDSSYAVTRYDMEVSEYANINYMNGVHLQQSFRRDSAGHYLPLRNDTYGRLSLTKHIRLFKSFYFHQVNVCSDYSFADTVTNFPDSLFGIATQKAKLPSARKVLRAQWNEMRPIELTIPELFIDSFRYELYDVPWAHRMYRVGRSLLTGYIPTSYHFDSSRFDFGPLFSTSSVNAFEGVRLRVGGTTKATLSPHNFAEGYVAYGFLDNHAKFNLTLTHAKQPHLHRATDYVANDVLLSLTLRHETESPGVAYGLFDRDNVLLSSSSRMMEYMSEGQLRYQRRWGSALSLDSWLAAQLHQPVGELSYSTRSADGQWQPVDSYRNLEWKNSLTLIPNRKDRLSVNAGGGVELVRDPFTLKATHAMGWFDNFYYNSTTLNAHKLFRMAPLGYLDLEVEAGKQWNQVPLPKLFFPSGSMSTYFITGAFNSLQPMEFVADQYVSLFANYHMRGLILNHIPVVKRLSLREVASFSLYWGSLSQRNDPDISTTPGLYRLPDQTQRLTHVPYMEWSVGVENILHIIRVDYVRRLTYAATKPDFKDCLRICLELSL